MDNYRRRPPMEGFSRPGQLGGEAFNDDDAVEGHIMTDQTDESQRDVINRKLDDDTEGHGLSGRKATDDDDTEGHGLSGRKATDDDDTEGHASLRNLR
ncbi:MAG: hypothetical protein M3Q38_01320 [Chloroflexota bacterium]|nr:hypothetical protein [Chloroflexota bacterium]